MALFNFATKEITLKIVYYGPGLSGKTTNLQHLHSILNPSTTGKLLSLSTESDRTLFFDFLPVELGKIRDFSIRFQLYTVPGQVRYNATRRIVLKGADAVIFVADSQRDMKEQNADSFANMMENLQSNNINPSEIPIVLQYNKRDLPYILTTDELNSELNAGSAYPVMEAVATKGTAVEETYKLVTKLLLKNIAKKHKVEIQPVQEKEDGKVSEQVLRSRSVPELELTPEPPRFAARPAKGFPEASPPLEDSFGSDLSAAGPAEEELPVAYAIPDEEEPADAYALEVEEEEVPSIAEAVSGPPVAPLSASDIFPDMKKEAPEPQKEQLQPPAESLVKPSVPPVSVSDIFAETKKETPVPKKERSTEAVEMKKFDIFSEMEKEAPAPKKEVSPEVVEVKKADIFAEMGRETPFPQKAVSPEVVEQKREVLTREAREVPVFPVEKIDAISQRVEKLTALLTEINSTLARMTTTLSLHETVFKEIKENKELREMKKGQGEMTALLKNIVSSLGSLKEKKSWFKF